MLLNFAGSSMGQTLVINLAIHPSIMYSLCMLPNYSPLSMYGVLYLHVFFELHLPLLVWYGQNLGYKPGYSPGYNLAYLHVIELNYLHLEWCSQFHVNSEPMDISVRWVPSENWLNPTKYCILS